MTRTKWSEQEIETLVAFYGNVQKQKIQSLLPNRSWSSIKLKANSLGLKFQKNHRAKSNASSLLENTPEAFYWMGFLTADGCFCKNRLSFRLGVLDQNQVFKFAQFIKCKTVSQFKNYFGATIQDSVIVPKLLKKFRIKPQKTYNPPDLKWMKQDLFLSFFIGFVDGDGSIGFQYGRKDCILRIKLHSSWLDTLQFMADSVSEQAGVNSPKVKINKSGYAEINFGNSMTLKFLKRKSSELGLPVLERKWNKIDENLVGRTEASLINKKQIFFWKSQGLKNVEIADKLGLSQSCVSVTLGKNNE